MYNFDQYKFYALYFLMESPEWYIRSVTPNKNGTFTFTIDTGSHVHDATVDLVAGNLEIIEQKLSYVYL